MNQHKFMKTVMWLVLIPALLLGMLAGCEQMQLSSGELSTFTTSVAPSSSTVPTSKPTVPTTAPTTVPTEPPTQAPTQPTEPPTQPTEPSAPPKLVPEHLRNNYYLAAKGRGSCDTMTGKVMVMVIFVNDSVSQWDAARMEAAKASFEDQTNKLEMAAAGFGAKLDMTILYLKASISMEMVPGSFAPIRSIMKAVDFEQAFDDQDILENGFGVDSVPVVFALNRAGRAFSANVDETSGEHMEFAVVYEPDLGAARHEICHTFGALDFYFPDTTVAAYQKYLPDSLMGYDTYREVDDLTAYLIGWTDELSENALQFLEATNHLTREEIEEAWKVS